MTHRGRDGGGLADDDSEGDRFESEDPDPSAQDAGEDPGHNRDDGPPGEGATERMLGLRVAPAGIIAPGPVGRRGVAARLSLRRR